MIQDYLLDLLLFLDQEKCVQGFYRESGLHLCISLPMCGPQNLTVI